MLSTILSRHEGGDSLLTNYLRSQEKKHSMQKKNDNNRNQDMNMYPGGQPGQNQQYYQPQYQQPQYQPQQQQGPGQGYDYNKTREGPYPVQDYGNGQSRGQSPQPFQQQYGYPANGPSDIPPAYFAQDEKKRMN
jgi:hypothetical protein